MTVMTMMRMMGMMMRLTYFHPKFVPVDREIAFEREKRKDALVANHVFL